MKVILNLVLFSSLFVSKVDNDLNKLKLNGKVKSIQEYSYSIFEQNDTIIKVQRAREFIWITDKELEFNKYGNFINYRHFRLDGSLDSRTNYEYNNENELIQKASCFSNIIFGGNCYYIVIKNENGKKIEEQFDSSEDNILISKEVTKYDENGNPKLLKHFSKKKLMHSIKYKYDKNSNLLSEILDNGSGFVKTTYDYDNKNRKIRELRTNDGKVEWETFYKYDSLDRKIMELRKSDNNNEWEFSYKYDSSKRLIEWIEKYPSKETIRKYEYENDINGNWIKRIAIIDGVPSYMIERNITYY